MDITRFIVSRRTDALLRDDYNSYSAHLSRRLLTARRRVGRATPKGKKYAGSSLGTSEDIARNHEYVYLWLLTAERAWAQAMHMKTARSTAIDAQGITGSTRRHIISRLIRASKVAQDLVHALDDKSASGATEEDILEARAYAFYLEGCRRLEKRKWEESLEAYSVTRAVYAALLTTTKKELFRAILSTAVDPNIRYAGYKAQVSRSQPIPNIVRKYYAQSEKDLESTIKRLDPSVFEDQSSEEPGKSSSGQVEAPQTVTWRGRTVKLEDAAISSALASASSASIRLMSHLGSPEARKAPLKDRAAAYDEVLIASQDAVDATKHAIDELMKEGVGQSDQRMQSLQITRTAVQYALVGWRVGRNRTLIGSLDGAITEDGVVSISRKNKGNEKALSGKPLGRSKKLGRLRERVVLYDGIIQSIDSIKELPGVARDKALTDELEAKREYFQSLKCLSIARSHSLLSAERECLALLSRAVTLSSKALRHLSSPSSPPTTLTTPSSNDQQPLLTLDVHPETAKAVHARLRGELTRQHALVELINQLSSSTHTAADPTTPLIDNLNQYPSNRGGGNSSGLAATVDLTNLVTYPPKLEPVPVKPLFLDVAWNYIDYPGRQRHATAAASSTSQTPASATAAAKGKDAEEKDKPKEGKRGWFSFGR